MKQNLEKDISLSEVDISGDDSDIKLLAPCRAGKTESETCFTFVADTGVLLPRRIFQSDNVRLKIDLKIHISTSIKYTAPTHTSQTYLG